MPCFHPLTAWKTGGGVTFKYRPGEGLGGELQLPCGQCIGCRLERSRQWAVRGMHEAQLHDRNCMVNLTYNDEHVPTSLERRHFQLFMKRLRKQVDFFDVTLWMHTPRYLMCGEYGDRTLRPHFHVALFGYDFPDKYYWKKSPSGFPLYRSPSLEKLWTMGDSTLGEVTFDSVAYIARYVTKKVTGEKAEQHYTRVDDETGEIVKVTPEFNGMSLKPGIGARWWERYKGEVIPHDRVVVNGVEAKPPRYYDKKLEETEPERLEKIKQQRKEKAKTREADNTPERLKVREQVTHAQLNLKRRTLE